MRSYLAGFSALVFCVGMCSIGCERIPILGAREPHTIKIMQNNLGTDPIEKLFRQSGAYIDGECFMVNVTDPGTMTSRILLQPAFLNISALFVLPGVATEIAEMLSRLLGPKDFSMGQVDPFGIDFVVGTSPWDAILAFQVVNQMRRFGPEIRFTAMDLTQKPEKISASMPPIHGTRVLLVQTVLDVPLTERCMKLVGDLGGNVTNVVACWDTGAFFFTDKGIKVQALIEKEIPQWRIERCPDDILNLPVNTAFGVGSQYQLGIVNERMIRALRAKNFGKAGHI